MGTPIDKLPHDRTKRSLCLQYLNGNVTFTDFDAEDAPRVLRDLQKNDTLTVGDPDVEVNVFVLRNVTQATIMTLEMRERLQNAMKEQAMRAATFGDPNRQARR